MRDYRHIDRYLHHLANDIYEQPPDAGHLDWAISASDKLLEGTSFGNVLDVGCGQGFMKEYFERRGMEWTGVTLGKDFEKCKHLGNVYERDMSFLPFRVNTFDLVFARHVLEHSPMPLLTLMEWHRVAKRSLLLVLPCPDYWTYRGTNHYSVMADEQIRWLLELSRWEIIRSEVMTIQDDVYKRHETPPLGHENEKIVVEYQYLCKRLSRTKISNDV